MTTLFVGDVHGCAAELGQLLDLVNPDRVVLVGNLFLKGPDPEGVWALVRDRRLDSVLGNHDDRLLRHLDGDDGDAAAVRCAKRLDAVDPDWKGWLRALPLFVEAAGFTVVHAAIHPSGDLARTERSTALTLRRWPGDEEGQPYWWQVYEGERKVAFGHDARRGLVRVERDGRVQLVGLDTGCVYGGKLSGWIAEEDRLVQVDAKKRYAKPG